MSFTAIITANVTDFEKGVQQAQSSIDGLAKSVSSNLSKIGDKFTNIGQKMSIASAAIIAAGAASFKMAADFQDAMGATDQVFKENAKVVQDWASNLPSMYGIAKKEALEYANIMGSMLVNIGGLTQEQAAKQSASLIQLAGDLTAMFGGTTQDAVRALTGALKGNNTMLDNYGMAVNDTLVKQRAFELGLIRQGEELSLVAKQSATLSLIYEQSGAAQGQAAREADGASGAMRALGVEFKNLSTELGEVLLPVLTPFVAKLRDLTASLREISPEALQTGVVIAGLVAVIGPLLLIIGKLIAILPTLTVGFLAVKAAIIGMTGPVGLLVFAISAALIYIATNFKEVVATITSILDFFMDYVKTAANFWKSIVTLDFKNSLNLLSKHFDVVFGFIYKIVNTALSEIAGALASFLGFVGLDKWSASVQSFANKLVSGYKSTTVAVNETTEAVGSQKEAIKEIIPPIDTLAASLKGVTKEGAALKELGIFDKLVGDGSDLNDIVARTAVQIQLMTARLEGLRAGTIQVANVKAEIEKTKKAVDDLSTAFTTLTGLSSDLATLTPETLSLEQVIIKPPKIDTSEMKIGLEEIKTTLEEYSVDIEGLANDLIGNLAAAFGRSIVTKDFGKSLTDVLGGLMGILGRALIGFGTFSLGLQKLIANPISAPLAIAAIVGGASLVAIGAMMSAKSQLGGAGSSAGAGGGASGSYQNTSSVGASDYRGQYRDDYVVNFKIGSNELVGVLDMANDRKNRL